jgi:hypothetical protein
MDNQLLFRVKEKMKNFIKRKKIVFILFCLLLSAYCLVISCGKKGPPTLKTSPPPSQSEHVDSNSGDTIPEKPPAEKQQNL